jgi:hypothetical protein
MHCVLKCTKLLILVEPCNFLLIHKETRSVDEGFELGGNCHTSFHSNLPADGTLQAKNKI